MKRAWLILGITSIAMSGISCSALKNMGGTLSKSDSSEVKEENLEKKTNSSEQDGRVDYTKVKTFAQRESEGQGEPVVEKDTLTPVRRSQYARADSTGSRPEKFDRSSSRDERPESRRIRATSDSTYEGSRETSRKGFARYDEAENRMAQQYGEMDRLAEVVLYELKIVERRYDKLIVQYKSASNSDRNRISAELDRLTADQLNLYRMYVKIYKDGKSNWVKTRSDIEDNLYILRGISNE